MEIEKKLRTQIQEDLPQAQILKVERVNNKYLSEAYELKRVEIQLRYRNTFRVEELLHATSATNVKSILENNLNWRLVKRAKYGRGVSFSSDANYANKYCNKRNGYARAFIICDVLVGKEYSITDNSHKIPLTNADTYRSKNGLVFVKFDDFTFNPKYVVYYQCSTIDSGSPLDHRILNATSLTTRSRNTTTKTQTNPRGKIEEIILAANMNRQVQRGTRSGITQMGSSTQQTILRRPIQTHYSARSLSPNRNYIYTNQITRSNQNTFRTHEESSCSIL